MRYVSDESLHSLQSVAQVDIPVDELRKMWKLPTPKLFVRIIGEIDESIGHKTLFDIKECLEDLVEFLVQKDCWLLIEIPNFQYFKYLESFLEKTTISAGACISPLIGLYTGLESLVLDRKGNINSSENDFLNNLNENINHYILSSCSTSLNYENCFECFLLCNGTVRTLDIVEKCVQQKKPLIILRGSGGIADVIGDCIERGRKHSIYDVVTSYFKETLQMNDTQESIIEEKRSLMKRLEHLLKEIDKPFQVLYINGKLQDSNIAEGILTAIKDAIEGLTTEHDKSLLIGNKKYLMLCLHLNQLNIAAEFGALWKVVKMKLPYCQDIFKEAVQLERYDFVQYMMSQGLELNTVIQANIFSVFTGRSLTDKERKIKEWIKKLCQLPTYNENIDPMAFSEDRLENMFKQSVFYNQHELSKLLWRKLKSPIAAALFAYGMLKAMVKCETDDDEIIVIKEHMLEYQKYAIETVNITYTKTRESTLKLLGQQMITWGNTTCILLALRTGNRKFLSQAPCRKYRHTVWTTGSSSPRNVSQQKTGNNECNICTTKVVQLHKGKPSMCWRCHLKNYLCPQRIAICKFICWIIFLLVFASFLLLEFNHNKINYLEITLLIFIVTFILENISQLKLLIKFLLLVFVLCFAYAISSESVLRCNEDFNWTPPFYFFRRTIWAMFGEFLMDEFKKDNINSDQPECISELGSYFASLLLAIFFIIVNILMFNLLIALFNSKIKAVEERSREFWHHQFMLLSMKYCKTVFLPPPFTVLFPLLIYCNAGGEKGIFNQKEILPAELINLQRLEASGRFKFIQETEDRHISVVCNGIIKCPHKEEMKLLRTVTQQTEQDEVTVGKKPKSPQHSEKKDVFVRPSHIISANRPSSTTNAVTPSSNINAKKSFVTHTQDISTNVPAVSDSGDIFDTDYYY
ncbi:hypothetical protein Btru_047509 [Bulinus truncatus]|nr:hypothetical protein Btru_047509 [Bulinus truncatus]